MKKIQILILALFVSFTSYAANLDETILVTSVDRKVVVDFSNLEQIETTVIIRDIKGEILFKEKNENPANLHNQFLFTEIAEETFVMTVENKFKVLTSTYQLVDGQAVQLGGLEKTYKPVIVQKGEKVLVNMMNPAQEAVTIKIANNNGEQLVNPIIADQHVVLKSIDFSKFRGETLVTVQVNGLTFTENFSF